MDQIIQCSIRKVNKIKQKIIPHKIKLGVANYILLGVAKYKNKPAYSIKFFLLG